MAKQGLWVTEAGETEVASGGRMRGCMRPSGAEGGPAHGFQARHAEAHDAEALRNLLELHRGDIRRFAASRLGDGVEADDIAQQTLFQAILNLAAFRGGNLRGWLLAIARRLVIDRRREQGRSRSVAIDEDFIESEGSTLRTPHDRVQAICEARERIRLCLDCIAARLSPKQQVAVLLADVHGCLDSQSAARMEMNMACFKSLLRKGRRRLHAAAGWQCSLVAKAGVEHACPDCPRAHDGCVRICAGHSSWRGGLDAAALTVLRRELVGALGLDDSGPSRQEDEEAPEHGQKSTRMERDLSRAGPFGRLGLWHGETKALPDVMA